MITEKLQNAINEQITAEMWSANMYLAMSFYMEKEGFSGMAHWLKKQWAGCRSQRFRYSAGSIWTGLQTRVPCIQNDR